MLRVDDVTVRFGERTVLDRFDLTVADGEVVAMLGPSGSGKSTLLRVIAGLIQPDTGRVWLDGHDVTSLPTHRRNVGMVFQDEQLFPNLNVADNIAFGPRMHGWSKADTTSRVTELLDLVGLTGMGQRAISRLSGGEAKRVALARSLAPRPAVLLLDEPLTGLDRDLHDRLAIDVAQLLRADGTTALLVTHDHDEAATIASRRVNLTAVNSKPDVVQLGVEQVRPLRRSVLRAGMDVQDVSWPEDDLPGVFHLGIVDAGEVVAVSTWIPQAPPEGLEAAAPSLHLRGMAADSSRQGSGLGSTLLAAGLVEAKRRGYASVWANARDAAINLYIRNGFTVIEPGFTETVTQLAHHRIVRTL